MQQAFKTLMGQMSPQNSQVGNTAFSPGSPFPFPPPPTSSPTPPFPFPSPSSQTPVSKPVVTVDVTATKVEATPATEVRIKADAEKEPKRYAFVDVSPEEQLVKEPFESSTEPSETNSSKVPAAEEVSANGALPKKDATTFNEQYQSTRNPGPTLTVDTLEKMMEDPTVQKMVYP
ncbi:hypothetical protein ACLOJK_016991 [Asimina triloba]